MKLRITKSGIYYGTFKFGMWEYIAISLTIKVWVAVILLFLNTIRKYIFVQ